jgi:hypothetical protein
MLMVQAPLLGSMASLSTVPIAARGGGFHDAIPAKVAMTPQMVAQ